MEEMDQVRMHNCLSCSTLSPPPDMQLNGRICFCGLESGVLNHRVAGTFRADPELP